MTPRSFSSITNFILFLDERIFICFVSSSTWQSIVSTGVVAERVEFSLMPLTFKSLQEQISVFASVSPFWGALLRPRYAFIHGAYRRVIIRLSWLHVLFVQHATRQYSRITKAGIGRLCCHFASNSLAVLEIFSPSSLGFLLHFAMSKLTTWPGDHDTHLAH